VTGRGKPDDLAFSKETRPGGKGGGEQTPPGEDLMETVKGGVKWGEDPMETILECVII
jgi:hypothetical protein